MPWWRERGRRVRDILERGRERERPIPRGRPEREQRPAFDYASWREREGQRPAFTGAQYQSWREREGQAAPVPRQPIRYRPGAQIARRAGDVDPGLKRALGAAVEWFRGAQGRIGSAGAGRYTPVRLTRETGAPGPVAVPGGMRPEVAAQRVGERAPELPTATFAPGATLADVAANLKQMRILGSPLPGRAWAALGEAGGAVGGGLIHAAAVPAQEVERAIGGAAVGIEAARQAAQRGLPLAEQARVAGAGYQLGRQAVGPVAYTLAGEQLAAGAQAIGGPESGTLAPLFGTPAPAGIERARQARELAQQGATPEEIAAQVGSPVVEAAGQILLDPLNFLSVGATARRQAGEAGTARRYFTEADPRSYDEIRDTLRAGGNPRPAAGPIESIANVINPRTQAGRAELLIEDTSDVVTVLTSQAENPEQRIEAVRNLINLGDPDAQVAGAARAALADFGAIPESQAGKQATVFLRELATDAETGKVDPGVIERVIRQAETPEAAAEALVRKLESAADDFYQVKRTTKGGVTGTGFLENNPIKRVQNSINGPIVKWGHLGLSGSYAHRNFLTGRLHAAADGVLSFASADRMAAWTERFGYRTRAATRAIGGAAGVKAGEAIRGAGRFRPITMREAYSTLLKKESWKEGPTLALAQAFEQWESERVWQTATSTMWNRSWRYGKAIPNSPVIDALPNPLRNYVLGRVSSAMDPRELNALITDLRKQKAIEAWRIPDDALTQALRETNPGLADAVTESGGLATDREDFARRLDELLTNTDQHTTSALADDTPLLTQADPAADDVTLIAQTEGAHAATETGQRIAAGRQQRDAARVMAWTRLEDIPEQARQVAQRVGDWVGEQIVATYRAADEATARWMAREISFDEAEQIKRNLWDTFTQQRDAQYQQALAQLGPDAQPLMVLRQADDAAIAQAAQTKQRAASVWQRYRAGEIQYDAAKAEVEQLWDLHNRYATTKYDEAWRALGGAPSRGPISRIGTEPIQRSQAALRRELAGAGLDAGIPGVQLNKAGEFVPNPRLLNTVNKDLEAAGLERVRRLSDMDAQQMEAATQALRRRAAGEAIPAALPRVETVTPALETAQAAPAIAPTKARAVDLDEYAHASGLDPGQMSPNDWNILAQNARAEGQRLIQRGDELARGVQVSTRRGAKEEIEAFGTTIRGRVGGISAREAQRVERGLSQEARAAALEDMGNLLQRAGFNDEELAGLNFQQRRRILEELGQGDLLTTKGGKPVTIDAIDPERRTELIQQVQPDVARIASATATEPTTGRGYTLIEWADDAQRRADAVRWVQSLDADARARELDALRDYRRTLDEVVKEATGEELLQIQDEIREIDARLWALEPPAPRRVTPRAPTPEIPQAEPPERIIQEIADSLDDAPPTRATLSAENGARAEPILQQIRAGVLAAPTEEAGRLDARTLQQVENYIKGLVPRMNENKAIAARVGSMERDFTLLNYGDRRLSDTMMSYVLMYGFWPSRTVPNWARRIANNPALLARYMRYKQAQHQMNADLPEWWREQIAVNPFGLLQNPLYMNIEQTLNPLYQLVNDFEDRDRGGPTRPLGQAMQQIGNVGFGSVWMPLQMMYALSLAQRGDAEGAQAWTSYLGTPTRTLRYATSLLRQAGAPGIPAGGIVLEPWLWQGGMFQGGDKWERRRIGKALYDLHREGTITYEQMVDAAYSQTGDIWDQAMQRAAVQRAPGAVAGYLLGQGFKTRQAYEIDIDRAGGEFAEIMDRIETMTPEQKTAAFNAFYEKWPWYGAVQMSKKKDVERDVAIAWDTLRRLPPGNERKRIIEAARMDEDLLSRFFDDADTDLSSWNANDRARFMASVLDMAAVLRVPDALTKEEWKKVQSANRGMWADINRRWPDYQAKNDEYWRITATQGEDAGRAYLNSNPDLLEAWSYKTKRITTDPLLFAYYGDQTDLEKAATNDLYVELDRRFPGARQGEAQYYQAKDAGASDDQLKAIIDRYNLGDYWDFKRIGKEFIAAYPPEAPTGAAPQPAMLRPEAQPISPTQQAITGAVGAPVAPLAGEPPQPAPIAAAPRAPGLAAAVPAGGAPTAAGQAQTIAQLNWQQPTGTYAERMLAAAGDTLAWTYAHGTPEDLTRQLTNRLYDEAERRFPGAREASAEYGKLKDGGASKAELKAFRESHAGLTDYWDYTSAGRDYIKENELEPGGTQRALDAYIDRMLGGTGGAGLTGPIALEKARQYSESGDFHLGPRKRQFKYRMTEETWNKLPDWVKASLGDRPYITPLYGEGKRYHAYRRGGGHGRGQRAPSPSVIRRMSAPLIAQLQAYFAGGPALEEGALRELQALGIGNVESLRALFAQPIPAMRAGGTQSRRARPTFWRAF